MYAKGLCGLEISGEIKKDRIRFVPKPSEAVLHGQRNNDGFQFESIIGTETVWFDSDYAIGQYRNKSGVLGTIIITPIHRDLLVEVLVEIVLFAKFGFRGYAGQSRRAVAANATKYVRKNPWAVIGATEEDWKDGNGEFKADKLIGVV